MWVLFLPSYAYFFWLQEESVQQITLKHSYMQRGQILLLRYVKIDDFMFLFELFYECLLLCIIW